MKIKEFLKKSLAVLFVILFSSVLAGCGEDSAPIENLKVYEGGFFTINIKPEWKIITQSDFYPEIPKETIVAFTLPEAYDGFFANINVIKETLDTEVSSIDYARANINLAEQNLTDYRKYEESQIDLNGEPAIIHIFEARLNPTEKLTRFVQLYVTKGKDAYIVSGGTLPDESEKNQEIRNEIGNSVISFRLK